MELVLSCSLKGKLTVLLLILLSASTLAQKRRMVNLGGWLVIERYLTPHLFVGFGSEVQTDSDLSSRAPGKVKDHYATFVSEMDFQYLSEHNIQGVRIPLGWWIAQESPPPPPYVDGGLQALDNAFRWGEKHGIQIVLDLHAAPGAQNHEAHSGSQNGVCEWQKPENIARTLDIIDFLASRYKNHKPFLGIELLNEPWSNCVTKDVLRNYYSDGYDVVRKHSSTAYVILCQILGEDTYDAANLLTPEQKLNDRVVLDVHLYNYFGGECDSTSAKANIDCINVQRKGLVEHLNAELKSAKLLIGEWANVWHASDEGMRKQFSEAQLAVYGEASFGWAYWTLSTDTKLDNGIDYHWSFRKNVEENLI